MEYREAAGPRHSPDQNMVFKNFPELVCQRCDVEFNVRLVRKKRPRRQKNAAPGVADIALASPLMYQLQANMPLEARANIGPWFAAVQALLAWLVAMPKGA